jgi:hypothetical protein
MSTFNFNTDSISSSASIAASISEAYNPGGKTIVKNTSLSETAFSRDRTLTTRSLADVMSGDFLFRSAKFSATYHNKSVNSSINSLITGGAAAAFSTGDTFKITDPEGITSESEISGGTAFLKVISQSALGRKGVADFVKFGTSALANTMSSYNSYDQTLEPGSVETGPGVDNLPSTGLSSGARYVVVDSNLSEEEKTWMFARAHMLEGKSVAGDASAMYGFRFDLDNALAKSDTNRVAIFSSQSHFPGSSLSHEVPNEIILQAEQTAYVCPAMIELLLYLASKIHIVGGFGTHRAANPQTQGSNMSAVQPGSFVSDHVFGRAFDIGATGDINKSEVINFNSQGSDANIYRKGLDYLLLALNSAPANLIPDSIAIHGGLAAEFGVQSGQEDINGPLLTLYPNLKYTNFSGDDQHKSHIHMSFSGARGGIYTGPNGELGVEVGSTNAPVVASPGTNTPGGTSTSTTPTDAEGNPLEQGDGAETATVSESDTVSTVAPIETTTSTTTYGNTFLEYVNKINASNPFRPKAKSGDAATGTTGVSVSVTGSYTVPAGIDDEKFKKNYSTDTSGALGIPDLYALLRGTILADEPAAIFTGIAGREGGLRPAAICLNQDSGDYSIGMFQANMLLGAHGLKTYVLPVPNQQTILGWQIAYKDWQKDGVYVNSKDDQNFTTIIWPKVEALEKADHITLIDPNVFVPINQAYMLYTVITGRPWDGNKLGTEPEGGYIFFPWGDYGGGSPYGFISGIKYSNVKDIYVSGGGNGDALDAWVLKMFETSGKNSKAAVNAQRWIEGWVFKSRWSRDGWRDNEEIPPE